MISLISYISIVTSCFCIMLLFVLYPFSLWLCSLRIKKKEYAACPDVYSLSLVVVVRNCELFIQDKIRNCMDLDYPKEKLDILFYSDGSTDATDDIIESYSGTGFRLYRCLGHQGKVAALNESIKHCRGEIVVFSDADALLEPHALKTLVKHYVDPRIGGVCGKRVINNDQAKMRSAQKKYIKFDSLIKSLESRFGQITSNDGKLYSLRRHLYRTIPSGVTDDLFASLSLIAQGYGFVFEPNACVYIKAPARSTRHEIRRRQRIVNQSLRGLCLLRPLFNPFRHGWFSIQLLINKVLRRLLPVFLLTLLVSSAVLSLTTVWLRIFFIVQLIFYAFGFSHFLMQHLRVDRVISSKQRTMMSTLYYFLIGNVGILYGLITFCSGLRVDKWDPVKSGKS